MLWLSTNGTTAADVTFTLLFLTSTASIRFIQGRLTMHYTNRIFILILISLFLSLTGTAVEKEGRPNILMLCIDDLNDWVGYLGGHPQTITPHMDSLVDSGVTFSRMYAFRYCSPTRSSFLSGRRELSLMLTLDDAS